MPSRRKKKKFDAFTHSKIYGECMMQLNHKKDEYKKMPMPEIELPSVPRSPSGNMDEDVVRTERRDRSCGSMRKGGSHASNPHYEYNRSYPRALPLKLQKKKPSGIGHTPSVKNILRDNFVPKDPISPSPRWEATNNFMEPIAYMSPITNATNLESKQWAAGLRPEWKKPQPARVLAKRPRAVKKKAEAEELQKVSAADDPWHHIPDSSRRLEIIAVEKRRREMVRNPASQAAAKKPPPLQIAGGPEARPELPRTPKDPSEKLRTFLDLAREEKPNKARSLKLRNWQKTLLRSTNIISPIQPKKVNDDSRWPAPPSTERERRFRHAARMQYSPTIEKKRKKRKKRQKGETPRYESGPACSLAMPDAEAWKQKLESEHKLRARVDTLMKATYNLPQFEGSEKWRKLPSSSEEEEEEQKEDFNQTKTEFTVFDEQAAAEQARELEYLKRKEAEERDQKEREREIYVLEDEKTAKYLEKAKAKEARRKTRIERRKKADEERRRKKVEEKERKEEEARLKALDDLIEYNEMDYVQMEDDDELKDVDDDPKYLDPEALQIKSELDAQRAKLAAEVEKISKKCTKLKRLLSKENRNIEKQHQGSVEYQKERRQAEEAEEERRRQRIEYERKLDEEARLEHNMRAQRRIQAETEKTLAEERALKAAQEADRQRKELIRLEDERMLEGMPIDSCPASVGAPICELGGDGHCLTCGGVPAGDFEGENEDDDGLDGLRCPMQLGKKLCPPGPDGTCRTCGIRARDVIVEALKEKERKKKEEKQARLERIKNIMKAQEKHHAARSAASAKEEARVEAERVAQVKKREKEELMRQEKARLNAVQMQRDLERQLNRKNKAIRKQHMKQLEQDKSDLAKLKQEIRNEQINDRRKIRTGKLAYKTALSEQIRARKIAKMKEVQQMERGRFWMKSVVKPPKGQSMIH
uniref:Uncharacterized protein n=2 Tax=Lotharella globosa TaxID=91324 RepID=A0A7S3YM27_9EUKA|mmetsp:Transcript_16304/g.33065  ORF Transcript_16304/g.33065 Transcript_16304/m.33065 type:complete len:931 (-) Transcript_16304:459-3251(-)